MKKVERQIDFQLCGLQVREAEDGKKSRTIVGHAVVFGVRSVNLVPWSSYREIYEIMEPGSITQELVNRSDVVLTAFHDNHIILGRWRMGRGTLKLTIDQKGLRCECKLAETATADELLTSIERGDITGMSFAYTADEEDSENGVSYEKTNETHDGKEVWLRHVKRVNGLYDVTIAGHPAYEQTDVAQREICQGILDKIEAPIKAEEEKKRKQREADEAAAKAAAEKEHQRRLREQEMLLLM